jgi:hypothetical protein
LSEFFFELLIFSTLKDGDLIPLQELDETEGQEQYGKLLFNELSLAKNQFENLNFLTWRPESLSD